MIKTKTKDLKSLIEAGKFTYVNSNITLENFPAEEIRSSDYKVFHFDKSISSEDAVKEIEKEGFVPANIYELLSWPDWNGKDWVVSLGSSFVLGGRRGVPYLLAWDAYRLLHLAWWRDGWGDSYRFLAVRNSSGTLGPKNSADPKPSVPQTLCPHCGEEVKVLIEKV